MLEPRMRKVPFHVKCRAKRRRHGGNWIGENLSTPVAATAYDTFSKEGYKAGVIVVMSDELLKLGNPYAEKTMSTRVAGVAAFLDQQFLTPTITAMRTCGRRRSGRRDGDHEDRVDGGGHQHGPRRDARGDHDGWRRAHVGDAADDRLQDWVGHRRDGGDGYPALLVWDSARRQREPPPQITLADWRMFSTATPGGSTSTRPRPRYCSSTPHPPIHRWPRRPTKICIAGIVWRAGHALVELLSRARWRGVVHDGELLAWRGPQRQTAPPLHGMRGWTRFATGPRGSSTRIGDDSRNYSSRRPNTRANSRLSSRWPMRFATA